MALVNVHENGAVGEAFILKGHVPFYQLFPDSYFEENYQQRTYACMDTKANRKKIEEAGFTIRHDSYSFFDFTAYNNSDDSEIYLVPLDQQEHLINLAKIVQKHPFPTPDTDIDTIDALNYLMKLLVEGAITVQ